MRAIIYLQGLCGALVAAGAALPLPWADFHGYRAAAVSPGVEHAPVRAGFVPIPSSECGIHFTNGLAEARGITNQTYYNASGVACGDVDGDGWPDLYLCSLSGDNRLYQNKGAFTFSDITMQAGLRSPGQASTGTVLADVDGDGDLDLLVSSIGRGVRCFFNNGRGVFDERTEPAGLASTHASMGMTLADVDADGDLDLYVANYRPDTFQDEVNVRFTISGSPDGKRHVTAVNGQGIVGTDLTHRYTVDARGGVQENAEPDVLYLNQGNGTFTQAPWTTGIFLDQAGRPLAEPPLGWGLSAMFRDMNGDGAPDLYVCNDGESPDDIWMNNGNGRFRAASLQLLRQASFSSMGIDFADINRDGFDDFFVADMLGYSHEQRHTLMVTRVAPGRPGGPGERAAVPRNTLFLNRGDHTFAEIAQLAGIAASDWSWCPAFLDVDLDGYEDLLVTTGLEKSLRNADHRAEMEQARRQGRLTRAEFLAIRRRMPRLDVPNFAFRNRGDLTFENASEAWKFNAHASSHGLALADLDNDGDLDVVVSSLNAPPQLYRNMAVAPRVAIRLRGAGANTRGIGAKITVHGGPVLQQQEMICGGRYLSGDDAIRTFAASTNGGAMRIEVRWRGGATSVVKAVQQNHLYEISEETAAASVSAQRAPMNPGFMFQDVSDTLRHSHSEIPADDFALQPMLPRRLSHFSPGVAWVQLSPGLPSAPQSGDALLVGAGKGGTFAVFTNGGAQLQRAIVPALSGSALDDMGGLVCWPVNEGTNLLAFTQSTLKGSGSNAVYVFELTSHAVKLAAALPAWSSAPGALAAADVDSDGDLDLFAAGRVESGRYPAPASSRLYQNAGTTFVLDEDRSKAFARVGLVNGAVFADLDNNGIPELVLACEWDSLRAFRFESTRVVEITKQWNLDRWKGLWQGITAADLNGDGRMDLVAANWGRNHAYARYMREPFRIYFADIDGDGVTECVQSFHDPGLGKHVPARHWDTMSFRFPFLQQQVRSFAEYSRLGMRELLADVHDAFEQRGVNTFDSTVFINNGNSFRAVSLPMEAQIAPAFGVTAADLDGDGREDLALAQNFSGTDSETSPLVAGRGLVLLGDGTGQMRAVPGQVSGIVADGDGRGAASCDFDGDGRVDLVIAQNNGPTKLYRNVTAPPGLRVRLVGPPGNQVAAGAIVRPVFADGREGAAREVHAGSGWLSQDSATILLSGRDPIREVKVRWPGRKITSHAVRPGARELVAAFGRRPPSHEQPSIPPSAIVPQEP